MFLDYYHLREQPFGVTPDSRYLYLSRTHREALASLFYGVEMGRGFMALIAPPGMGKTTVLSRLLERLSKSTYTSFLFQTQCDSEEFLRFLLEDMGIDSRGQDPVEMRAQLNEALLRIQRAGRRFVLVVDEAQNLKDSVLETIRLLSDFETPSAKLMQIVLAGQPQLAGKLARPSLVQLRQRIAVLSRLEAFTATETDAYIDDRLQVAGYEGGPLFTPQARVLIAAWSGGIPRKINNICFNALSLGYTMQCHRIDGDIVREAVKDLDLTPLIPERDTEPRTDSPVSAAGHRRALAGERRRGRLSGAVRATALAACLVLASFSFPSARRLVGSHLEKFYHGNSAAPTSSPVRRRFVTLPTASGAPALDPMATPEPAAPEALPSENSAAVVDVKSRQTQEPVSDREERRDGGNPGGETPACAPQHRDTDPVEGGPRTVLARRASASLGMDSIDRTLGGQMVRVRN
jgi:general secretion pathway protein A